jgi:superfamily I DNA and/or RNA helicase
LPPTVKSPKAAELGLSETLLERCILQVPNAVFLLKTQYRMNADIMAFSNQYFYQNRLEAHDSVATRIWLEAMPAVVFIDTAGCGFEEQPGEDGASLMNPEEIRMIENHMERYQVNSLWTSAVISPYRAQVTQMQEQWNGAAGIRVNTIDSFQGQEEEMVYISLVRSNDRSEIGFLKDYRRMNVAMTRAKRGLVVIGDSATLAKDPFYSEWMDWVEKLGGYSSAWELI